MNVDQQPVFNPALYPRVYKPSSGYLFFLVTTGLLCAAGGIAGIIYFGTAHEMTSAQSQIILVVLSFLFLLLGVYLIGSVRTSRLIVSADSIELKYLVSSKLFFRSDIAGYRVLPTQYIATLVLQPKSIGQKKLKIPMYFRTDDAFAAWFNELANLDRDDFQKSQAELESAVSADDSPGPETKAERVAKARTTVVTLNVLALVSAFWAFIYPPSYPLAVASLAILPLVVIALFVRSRGIYQMEGRRNDARPSLAFAFMIPAAVLMLRTISNLHFLEWKPLLIATLALAAVLAVFLAQSDPTFRERRYLVFLYFFLAVMYCYGAIAHFDVLADRSTPTTYETQVLQKRISRGRSTSYYLRVAPWGPKEDSEDVRVSPSLYRAITPGQSISIHLYSGAFHLPWFSVSRIPKD